MFITNGKSLFGNVGLIISLIILIILVYFSYNKCYINNNHNHNNNNNNHNQNHNQNNIESFETPCLIPPSLTDTIACQSPPPSNVRISIVGNSIIVNFKSDISIHKPYSFIIVLAQYDSNNKNTGNNKFYISNESIINPDAISTNTQPATTRSTNTQPATTQPAITSVNTQPLCTLDKNGNPTCQYKFSNIDIRDSDGNEYYYKLGVSAIYNDNPAKISRNSTYTLPNNISNNLFTLVSSIDNQDQDWKNFQLYKKSQNAISANTYSDTISTADGKYELIKAQLGNYPDNLLIDEQTIDKNTLSDIVDKSMAQALLNINVLSSNTPSVTNIS